ncbi:hypothetical protein BGW38_006618 [Lunasporangiospora selenospora]|uniref:Uncharacterized protein n=1 Tax=Lunasporangiospora selenospora TaxID=979761 RepID=A0A9P6FLL3_9FUNG|nr:hypothetical protein BGW38_006618 [Lunasporangiospora selenospora]
MSCLWFYTAEGLKFAASVVKHEKFGPGASALLKRHSALSNDVDDRAADGSFAAVAGESIADETVVDESIADETVVDESFADGSVPDESFADESVPDEPIPLLLMNRLISRYHLVGSVTLFVAESKGTETDALSIILPRYYTHIAASLPYYDSLSSSDKRHQSSPTLPPRGAKRLNVSGQLIVTPSDEGIVRLALEFGVPFRDLGIRYVPSPMQPAEGLSSLLAGSPYEGLLSGSTWIEFPRCQRLSEEWDNILSGCWVETPLLNYATAALFAGCVLFNPRSRSSVLCLVAESYGRGVDVDVHCEKVTSIGDSVSPISQPSTSGFYPHATVCGIQHDTLDHRLVLGCKNFNILFTEVWRLDKDRSSERAFTAGCCWSAFPVGGNDEVRIFIDKRSFVLASDVASGMHDPRFDIDRLRQIRSHLCSAHSYRLGRASSCFISNMVSAQATSIFTLTLVYPASGDASLGSSVLSRIAREVNAKGRKAVLKKEVVTGVLKKVKADKSCAHYLGKILLLFDDKDEIGIFDDDGSLGLEDLLVGFADCVSGGLGRRNENVVVPQLTREMS